ncbi:MAG: hypothetical protein AAF938_03905 [Myxococcota bacterium]
MPRFLYILALVFGCSESGSLPDTGGADAAPMLDGGPMGDAGATPDEGIVDAGGADEGAADEGTATDAGTRADGGGADSGEADAGGPDAGGDADISDGPLVADRLLLDNDAGFEHLNLEISPDLRWATLNERDQTTFEVHPMLLAIDDEGVMEEACYYGDVSLRTNSSMQFGESGGVSFAVAIDVSGRDFVIIEPERGRTCDEHLRTVPLRGIPADYANNEIRNPYPIRGSSSGRGWVAFHRHADAINTEAVLVQDVFSDDGALVAWSDRRPNARRAFGTFASVARWVPGREVVFAGRWSGDFIQAAASDLRDVPSITTAIVTNDASAKPDLSPFVSGGRVHMFTNDDGGPNALVYREGADGELRFLLEIPFDPSQSTVEGTPRGAISLEAFEWEGELYTSYMVADADDRAPGCRGVNCMNHELWMAAFARDGEGNITRLRHNCRISSPAVGDFRGKVDPEPVPAGNRLMLYYHRSDLTRMPGRPGNQLALVEIDDRARFDEACAAGDAAAR